MTLPVLKIAVVGHTNVGKTSLLRTLLRDVEFGEVSVSPATTRHVEGVSLLVGGECVADLYDTPGLEDSIGLLEHLDAITGERRMDGIDVIREFLSSDHARRAFSQEAKALRQVLASDVALYVIDARDRVSGKLRDELEILGCCAKPVVPVLNFVAGPETRTAEWREHLARVNMHAVVEFDTVVLDGWGERRLFEKISTLLDPYRETLEALIEDRARQRKHLIRASADLIAELLIDVAAHVVVAAVAEETSARKAMETMQQTVRDREQKCVDDLLAVHGFREKDFESGDFPIIDGKWGLDLFSPEALKDFGIRATGAAAAGAMAGLAVDVMVGGLTMGVAAATGAALGALFSATKSHGSRIIDRVRGFTELRVDDQTIRLLAARQNALVQALFHRGHASQDLIGRLPLETKESSSKKLPEPILLSKIHPDWSSLSGDGFRNQGIERRIEAVDDLAGGIERRLSAAQAGQ